MIFWHTSKTWAAPWKTVDSHWCKTGRKSQTRLSVQQFLEQNKEKEKKCDKSENEEDLEKSLEVKCVAYFLTYLCSEGIEDSRYASF